MLVLTVSRGKVREHPGSTIPGLRQLLGCVASVDLFMKILQQGWTCSLLRRPLHKDHKGKQGV